jgi:ketosteroid isomerase-like protein
MTACDLVRVAFDRLNAGDVTATLELFHAEVVIINPPAMGLGVPFPTHIFGVDELRVALEGVDLSRIERKIESIKEISPGVVSAPDFISVEGTWGAAQWLGHVTDEGSVNYVEGHLYFRVPGDGPSRAGSDES